jgi:hypothetical protein
MVFTVKMPQSGAQFAPPAVRVQVTPAAAVSFDTEAFTVTGEEPVMIVANLFVIETTIGLGERIEKLKLSLAVVSVTEVAVMVGDALAPVGIMVGGV